MTPLYTQAKMFTDKQNDTITNATKNITYLAKVIIFIDILKMVFKLP